MKKVLLKIDGMTCSACSSGLEKYLNKQDGIKDWTYSNYTKLVYKKVFGKSKANEIKKMYRLSEKENIRDSLKIPQDKITEIVDWEYSIHCYLQTLKKQNTPISELYDKVKNFLQLN